MLQCPLFIPAVITSLLQTLNHSLCLFRVPLLFILNMSPFLNMPCPSSRLALSLCMECPSLFSASKFLASSALQLNVTCPGHFLFYPSSDSFLPCTYTMLDTYFSPSLDSALSENRNCVLSIFVPIAPNLILGLW